MRNVVVRIVIFVVCLFVFNAILFGLTDMFSKLFSSNLLIISVLGFVTVFSFIISAILAFFTSGKIMHMKFLRSYVDTEKLSEPKIKKTSGLLIALSIAWMVVMSIPAGLATVMSSASTGRIPGSALIMFSVVVFGPPVIVMIARFLNNQHRK